MADGPVPHGAALPEKEAPSHRRAAKGKKVAAGLAFGIGSAAVVAALLYAGRKTKEQPKGDGPAPRPLETD